MTRGESVLSEVGWRLGGWGLGDDWLMRRSYWPDWWLHCRLKRRWPGSFSSIFFCMETFEYLLLLFLLFFVLELLMKKLACFCSLSPLSFVQLITNFLMVLSGSMLLSTMLSSPTLMQMTFFWCPLLFPLWDMECFPYSIPSFPPPSSGFNFVVPPHVCEIVWLLLQGGLRGNNEKMRLQIDGVARCPAGIKGLVEWVCCSISGLRPNLGVKMEGREIRFRQSERETDRQTDRKLLDLVLWFFFFFFYFFFSIIKSNQFLI